MDTSLEFLLDDGRSVALRPATLTPETGLLATCAILSLCTAGVGCKLVLEPRVGAFANP